MEIRFKNGSNIKPIPAQEPHKSTYAYRRKKKTIRITIDLPMEFPSDWSNDLIEFYLNDSSFCCDNLIEDLREHSKENGCICGITRCKVVD